MQVELQNKSTGAHQSFPFSQAEGILRYEKSIRAQCWILPEGSNYQFINGKLVTIGVPEVDQGTEVPKRNSKGTRKKIATQTAHTSGD
jgi:hypothetical protein